MTDNDVFELGSLLARMRTELAHARLTLENARLDVEERYARVKRLEGELQHVVDRMTRAPIP